MMNYDNGLKILEAFAKLEDEQTFREFDLAKSQLTQNLSDEKLFGVNEGTRSNIYRAIDKLNVFARRLTDMSFTDLSVDTYQLDELLETLLRQTPWNKMRYVAAVVVHRKISANPLFLERLANAYQIPLITDFGDQQAEIGPAIEWQGPDDVELQSFLKPQPDMMDIGFLKQAITRSASVCKVEISPLNKSGTGFLITDTLVLTNYHVLGQTDEEVKNNAAQVVLRFGYTEENDNQLTYDCFHLNAKQPILTHSPANNGLDYVLLQVESNITQISEIQPAPYTLKPPSKGMGVHILQHPQGDTMKLAINNNGITGIYPPQGLIQYVTRAFGGSSGSPCFNDNWEVVALHHAERAKSFGKIREGILLSAIYEQIKNYL